MGSPRDVLVVGAGLAGLVAARTLRAAGADVALVDRGDGGGRLATQRVGAAVLDSGAQFFTVRSREFGELVEAWSAAGLEVSVWTTGFARVRHVADGPGAAAVASDGHPRHAVRGGLQRLAAHLARDLELVGRCEVRAVRRTGSGWRVEADGRSWQARRLLLTAPVPESLALLAAGDVRVRSPEATALARLAYAPAIALLLALDRPPVVPGGGVQIAEGPISWLGDNVAKGASGVPALTVHAAGSWSAAHLDDDDESVRAALLALVGPWLDGARPVAARVRRWPYAQPTTSHPERCLATEVAGAPLVLAGDAFGEAKVEGAARSGLAAARALGAGG